MKKAEFMGLDTSNEISFRRHVLYQSFPDPPDPGRIVRTQLSGGKNDLCIFFQGKPRDVSKNNGLLKNEMNTLLHF